MTASDRAVGGETVGVLNRLEGWEAGFIVTFRLWCSGPDGQAHVRRSFQAHIENQSLADTASEYFEHLVSDVCRLSHRGLVRRSVGCACLGSDEAVFLHLVRTASAGMLTDASLIATLLVGPAHAERIALLAGEVGWCCRSCLGAEAVSEAIVQPTLH